MTSWAERAKLHFLQECPKRTDKTDKTTIVFLQERQKPTDKTDKTTIVFLQERQKPTDKTDKTPLSSVLSVPFWHSCEKRDFQNQGFDVANDQTVSTSGTRRQPGLTPKLLAASLELDRQLVEAGISLDVPPEPPATPLRQVLSAKEVTPLHRKQGHFDIDAPWRPAAREYYAHHFGCEQCQCAGRGSRYGLRCGVGAALWMQYAERQSAQTPVTR
jgi:hypothetical protein